MTRDDEAEARHVLWGAGFDPDGVDATMAEIRKIIGYPMADVARAVVAAGNAVARPCGNRTVVEALREPRSDRTLWARYCGRCDDYGPARWTYEEAVEDGQAHAGFR